MALKKVIWMGLTKVHTRLVTYLMSFKKLLQDGAGVLLLRQWKQIEKENIVSVEDSMLPEIRKIQAEGFKNGSPEKLVKYS